MTDGQKENFYLICDQLKLVKEVKDLVKQGWSQDIIGEHDRKLILAIEDFCSDREELAFFYARV